MRLGLTVGLHPEVEHRVLEELRAGKVPKAVSSVVEATGCDVARAKLTCMMLARDNAVGEVRQEHFDAAYRLVIIGQLEKMSGDELRDIAEQLFWGCWGV